MTTIESDIRTKWKTKVFENSAILNITNKALDYELSPESEKEITDGSFTQELNFFEYVVSRSEVSQPEIGGFSRPVYKFLCEVRYTKQIDTDGTNFNSVVDAMSLLIDVVRAQLGSSWDSVIDYQEDPISIDAPTKETVADIECYRSIARFSAIKQI